ncbi:MAG: cob(I)yrinic acid a,c-diamide adenosyltransferase [Bacteroidales bacterium]|nr:cob(I)yrinic acid a,c-diamide adenosyltransferase [Bacteroidales bacterium]
MEKAWKIYTKTGDKGETSLIGGTRVPKYHERIEAYGTLDELNSLIGYLRDQVNDVHLRDVLLRIQENLFTVESELATDPEKELSRKLPHLSENDVLELENEIDAMNLHLPELSSFILPGGHPLVSLCHVCRTVCRRGERIIIKLASEMAVNEVLIKYINRLSDYLFVLARELAFINNIPDLPWKPDVFDK